MKQEVSPAVLGAILVVLLGVIGFFFWRGASGPGSIAPGAPGNPHPLSARGSVGKAGGIRESRPPTATGMPVTGQNTGPNFGRPGGN